MNYPKTLLIAFAAITAVGVSSHAAVVVASGVGTYSYSVVSGTTVALDSNATNVNVTPRDIGFSTGDRYSIRDNGAFGAPSTSSVTYDFFAPTGFVFTLADVFYRDQAGDGNGGNPATSSFTVTASYSLDGGAFTPLSTNANGGNVTHPTTSLTIAPGTTQITFRIAGSRANSDPGLLNYFGMGDSIFNPSTQTPGFVFNSTTVAVPEPASVTLLGLGLGAVFFFRRRRMTSLS